MGWATTPIVWAQGGASTNPAAAAYLALRRWCGGLTLSAPEPDRGLEAFWLFAAALAVLVVVGLATQGAGPYARQLFDVAGHARLVRAAAGRVWGSGRLIVAAIVFTVLSWTGSQMLDFVTENPDRGRADLLLLLRSGSRLELAVGQGLTAALSPLRDLAGLADNLPALVVAAWLAFRFASGPRLVSLIDATAPAGAVPPRFEIREPTAVDAWATVVWACAGLYAVYRLVGRAAGSPDLPVGDCLVVESLIVPAVMLVCDGFLLAWVLAELRDAGSPPRRDSLLNAAPALRLTPAAAAGCLLALPARYAATAVVLGSQHAPSRTLAGAAGRFVRWQLGWGLVEIQAASLVLLGAVGVVAWTGGTTADVRRGFRRLLARRAGRLTFVLAVAGGASTAAAAAAYLVVFLLPPAGWVLRAADGYAHYATTPVGLWTLAALVTLAEESLPTATAASESPPALESDAEAEAAEEREEADEA